MISSINDDLHLPVLPDTTTSTRRPEASGVGWEEIFVNSEEAALSDDVASAITDSLSYVTIPNFGTLEERCALQESALRVANDGHDQPHILGASDVNVNCTRYSVQSLLDDPAKAAHSTLLTRLLDFLEQDEELYKVFARPNLSDTSQNTADWYSEPDDRGNECPEPKVNIYGKSGYFKEHTDGMQLTLLVVLNDSFEGGGTAFFSQAAETLWADRTDRPDRVARPPAGTAMIWGGNLWHMALPVSTGMRAVYVGSFDLIEKCNSPEAD
mmetsp:Transcript_23384/g.28726  ORF Transcript_23384/g.28726 Transcript_23384/m.28726 type:complete len:269 (-) Transcript_23384:447-1253(-)